ncbi:efflux RND transporter periplasmic adaptor subunit [Alteromonas stellipolaris]|uniref:efflux RND transporter periplasmic adaptor subunit n=1 Tax=Alteromonas stellipolaris TaxID=233316 RepID=UPI0024942B8B|nr:efflux RND transporter periplasmic adaptor subunit [Alteromonas stellipolaris]
MFSRLIITTSIVLKITLLSTFISLLSGCDEQQEISKWPLDKQANLSELVKPAPISYSKELRFYGLVKGFNSIPISFLEAGRIESLLVTEGQVIKSGQTIGELYSPSLADKLSQAVAALEKVKVKLKVDLEELARNIKLFNKGVVSEQVLEQAKKAFDITTQEVREAQSIVKTKEKELSALTLVLNEDGIVSKLHKRKGDFLNVGEPLLRFDSTSRMKVSFNVPENVAIDLSLGEENNIFLPALNKVITAVLIEKSFPTTNEQFLHSLTYEISSGAYQAIGLRATLVVNIEPTLAHSIDYKAIRYDAKGNAYAIKSDQSFEKVAIDIIDIKNETAIVKANFNSNDHIVLGGDVSLPVNYYEF